MKFISGLRNCHVPWLNSYVIRERVSDSDGMIRIFHNTGTALESLLNETGDDFRLAPHNHRQDITLYRLFGSTSNVSFAVDRLPHRKDRFEYRFGSALESGEFSLNFRDTVGLPVFDVKEIPCHGLRIAATEVHSVVASPDSAWLVREGQIAPAGHMSLCYSKRDDLSLNSEGLYIPMSGSELKYALFNFSQHSIAEVVGWGVAA